MLYDNDVADGMSPKSFETGPSYLYDTCLPFGARLVSGIFLGLSQAVIRNIGDRDSHLVAKMDHFYLHHPMFEGCKELLNKL